MILIVLVVAILCMVIANYMWQREKNRREEEHERRMERFERLMELLKKEKDNQISDSEIKQDKNESK